MEAKKQIPMKHVYTVLCMIILTALIISLAYQILNTRGILEQNTQQLLTSSHNQTHDNITLYINNMESLLTSLCYNGSIQEFLLEEDGSRRLRIFKDVQTAFSSVALVQSDMMGFSLYNSNGEFLAANGSEYRAIIQAEKIEIPSSIIYHTIFPPNSYIGYANAYYVITVPIVDISTINIARSYLGAIVIIMDSSFMKSQIDTIALNNSNTVILDSSGKVLIPSTIRAEEIDYMLTDDEDYIIVESSLASTGWQLVTFLEKGTITEDVQPILIASIISALLILVCIIIFITLTNQYFLNPVINISRFMQKISENANNNIFSKAVHYRENSNQYYQELHTMEKSINWMLDSLERQKNNLLLKEKEYYETLLLKNRMEVLAYKNQINPHFLYNTLDCIRGIAISKNAMEIAEISQSLSNMFRYVVKGENFVTVSQELEYLKEYETILHYRFMGNIGITVSCDTDAGYCYIPIFILQPIVENGIFHGLERKVGDRRIWLNIFVTDAHLHLKVTDNGIGMTPEDLALAIAICEHPEQSPEQHSYTKKIGLSNIAHRLRIFYGKDSHIRIASTLGEGTCVEIICRAKWEEPENV